MTINNHIQKIDYLIRVNKSLFNNQDLNFYYEPKDCKEYNKQYNNESYNKEYIDYNDYNDEMIISLLKPLKTSEYKILFSCKNYFEKFKIIRYLLFLQNIQPLNRYFLNNYDFEFDNFENSDDYDIQYNTSCIYGSYFWFFESIDTFRKLCNEILYKMPDCYHFIDTTSPQYPIYFINKYCYKCIDEKSKILNLNQYLWFLFPLLKKKYNCPPEIVINIIDFLSPCDMVSDILKDLIYDYRISRISYHY
jgi:hypothetical protein